MPESNPKDILFAVIKRSQPSLAQLGIGFSMSRQTGLMKGDNRSSIRFKAVTWPSMRLQIRFANPSSAFTTDVVERALVMQLLSGARARINLACGKSSISLKIFRRHHRCEAIASAFPAMNLLPPVTAV